MLAFAREVNETLDACGFPLCKGKVMASNPELCLSLDEWKAKMAGWLDNPEAQGAARCRHLLRPASAHGRRVACASLRGWLLARTRARPAFLRLMATNALLAKPGLGVLGDFVTDDGSVNLKLHGVRPFVDAARVYALAFGLAQTATAGRLRAAVVTAHGPVEWRRSSTPSFSSRTSGCESGAPGHLPENANRLDPATLNDFERRGLKEAFRQARKLQQRLALDYHLEVVQCGASWILRKPRDRCKHASTTGTTNLVDVPVGQSGHTREEGKMAAD